MATPAGHILIGLHAADHPSWREQVRTAVALHGSLKRAAPALGIGVMTLSDWVRQEPGVLTGLERRGAGRPIVKSRSKSCGR
jgi:hypothetical protein